MDAKLNVIMRRVSAIKVVVKRAEERNVKVQRHKDKVAGLADRSVELAVEMLEEYFIGDLEDEVSTCSGGDDLDAEFEEAFEECDLWKLGEGINYLDDLCDKTLAVEVLDTSVKEAVVFDVGDKMMKMLDKIQAFEEEGAEDDDKWEDSFVI